MKKLILIFFISLVSFSSNAQEKKSKNAKHNIEVSGNCELCKKRIEKAAFSVPGVKSATWNPDEKVLHLIVNEEKASDLDVQKAVAKAGHDTKEVKATDEAYKNLHTCCAYERN